MVKDFNFWRSSRSSILRPAVLAALLLVAATACGGGDDPEVDASPTAVDESVSEDEPTASEVSETSTTSTTEAPTTTLASPYPVTIDHEAGTTTVESAPVRILALEEFSGLPALLALGVEPTTIGLRSAGFLEPPWLVERGIYDDDRETFTSPIEPNIELIAGFAPDLIVGQAGIINADNIDLFEGVAPTIAIGNDWQEGLRDLGAALDMAENAEQVIAEVSAEREALLERVPFAEGRSVAALIASGPTVFWQTVDSPAGQLLLDAGLQSPPEPEDGDRLSGNDVGGERLGEVETEGIIVFGGTTLASLEPNPLWSTLPAVESGRVFVVSDDEAAALFFPNALTLPFAIGLFEDAMNEFFGAG